jgi:hypothetical protein
MNECNFDATSAPATGSNLTESLYTARHRAEAQLNQADSKSTETLRLALRRYRSISRQLSLLFSQKIP